MSVRCQPDERTQSEKKSGDAGQRGSPTFRRRHEEGALREKEEAMAKEGHKGRAP